MKVSICAIAKNEDRYIDFWAKHYLDRGFDSITVYDNNDEKDLKCKYPIEIIPLHNQFADQNKRYEEYFYNNKDKFDWIYYTDLDEFLDCDNIKEFLSTIDDSIEQVQFKLMNVCNNDMLYPDYTKSPFDLFREPCENQWHSVKSMIKTTIKKPLFKNPHWFASDFTHSILGNLSPSNNSLRSRFLNSSKYDEKDFSDKNIIYHCDTKTIQEYLETKFNRSDVATCRRDRLCTLMKCIPDRGFFRYTKRTKERLEILSKAEFNGYKDIFINSIEDFDKSLLDTYRCVYIKGTGKNISERVKFTNNIPSYKLIDVAEFYIEDGLEKRKSVEQINNKWYIG